MPKNLEILSCLHHLGLLRDRENTVNAIYNQNLTSGETRRDARESLVDLRSEIGALKRQVVALGGEPGVDPWDHAR